MQAVISQFWSIEIIKDYRSYLMVYIHRNRESTDYFKKNPAIIAYYSDTKPYVDDYKYIGEIHFLKDSCGLGTIAHEVCHAILDFCKKKGLNPFTVVCGVGEKNIIEESICRSFSKFVYEIFVWIEREKQENKEFFEDEEEILT